MGLIERNNDGGKHIAPGLIVLGTFLFAVVAVSTAANLLVLLAYKFEKAAYDVRHPGRTPGRHRPRCVRFTDAFPNHQHRLRLLAARTRSLLHLGHHRL